MDDTDPDETAGRKLYRDRADAFARALSAIADRPVTYRQKTRSNPAKNTFTRSDCDDAGAVE